MNAPFEDINLFRQRQSLGECRTILACIIKNLSHLVVHMCVSRFSAALELGSFINSVLIITAFVGVCSGCSQAMEYFLWRTTDGSISNIYQIAEALRVSSAVINDVVRCWSA